MRGPTDEEPRISTPESPRRSPPPHSSRKGVGRGSAGLFPRESWPPACDRPHCAVTRPGARPSLHSPSPAGGGPAGWVKAAGSGPGRVG